MEIKNFKKNILNENSKLIKALKILNTTQIKIIFILNKRKELVGTITDGDLRRAFLKGYHTHDTVKYAMKKNPKSIYLNQINKLNLLNKYFYKNNIEQLPVLSKKKIDKNFIKF